MGSRPRKPKPTAQERALAKDSAAQWNDYVERYIPAENKFLEQTKATKDRVDAARSATHTDAMMAYGDAQRQVAGGLSNQGVAPGSGRSFQTMSSLDAGASEASGLGQAAMTQAVHDRELDALTTMSAFGRDLQGDTNLSLANAGRRATDGAIGRMNRRLETANTVRSTVASALGAASGHVTRDR